MTILQRWGVLGAVLALASSSGCGLVDSDITDFNLKLPVHDFQVNSADWGLMGDAIETHPCPATECSTVDFCAPSTMCENECENDTACAVNVPVNLVEPFHLATQAPELKSLKEGSNIDVRVEDVVFDFAENTLDIASPEFNIYIGRTDVTSGSHPNAKFIATVPSIPASATSKQNLVWTATGRDEFEAFLEDYETPFKIFVEAQVFLSAGDLVPQGSLDGSLDVVARVSVL